MGPVLGTQWNGHCAGCTECVDILVEKNL